MGLKKKDFAQKKVKKEISKQINELQDKMKASQQTETEEFLQRRE
jgi:ferritin